MANPYGIEQVDVPGILGAYDAARQRRVQMMLQQTQLEREQNQLDRETKLHTAFSKFVVPGAGMSGAASSYGTPAPPAPAMDPASPTAALASETTPAAAAAPSSAIPAPATDQRHPMASWMEANTPAIQDAMRADPQVGMQMIQNFSSLDAAAQQRVKAHLELADELNEHAIRHLATVHDQASWDAARTAYSAELQHYGAPVPDLPPTYDEKFVQGLRMSTLSTKEQLDAAKGVVMGEGSTLNNPYTGEQIANNPKPVEYQHVTLTRGDQGQDGYTFNPRTGAWTADGGVTTPGIPGAAPTSINVSPKMAAVASTLSAGGLSAPVVAGFMGNFHIEGGYDGAHGDGGSASGIAQLHAERVTNFQRVIGKPVDQASPAEQARFTLWEMQNPQAAGMTVAQRDQILAAKTPAEAASLIDQYYERSDGKARADRMAAATAFSGGTAGAAPTAAGGAPRPAVSSAGKPEETPLSQQEVQQLAANYKISRVFPPTARDKASVRAILNAAGAMSLEDAHRIADEQVHTWQDTKAAGETLTAFSKGPEARQVRSLSVAIEHLELYRQAAKALNTGNIPAFNSMAQAIARATGHPAPTNAAALHDLVMDEVVKGVVGTAAGVQDRDKAAGILTQNSSPAQMAGGFDQIGGLLLGQLHGLQQQYESGTGRHDFGAHLTPLATRVFEEYQRAHGMAGASSAGGIPTFTPEQARAAKPGTLYRTVDGRTLRR